MGRATSNGWADPSTRRQRRSRGLATAALDMAAERRGPLRAIAAPPCAESRRKSRLEPALSSADERTAETEAPAAINACLPKPAFVKASRQPLGEVAEVAVQGGKVVDAGQLNHVRRVNMVRDRVGSGAAGCIVKGDVSDVDIGTVAIGDQQVHVV